MSLRLLLPLRIWPIIVTALLPMMVYASPPSPDIGAQIYLQGLLPSGKPVRSTTHGDVELSGTQVSCVNCHKRSGQGSSEGRVQVPAVTTAALFKRTEIGRSKKTMRKFNADDNSFMMGAQRPVYTEADLRRVITTGIDPNGRALDLLMPRYQLSDSELDHLIAYLRTLSSEISPGVTKDSIHFATIIAGDVDKGQEKTMLDTLTRYFEFKNANTRNETGRASRSPWHKEPHYTAYRKWILHEWRLSGPANTWAEQLTTLYQQQPVFAVLSGLGNDEWAPVHEFCQKTELPCLFPNVNFAGGKDTDFYTTYFFDGTELEANSIAKYLTSDSVYAGKPVVQLHYDSGDSLMGAQALKKSLDVKSVPLTTVQITGDTKLDDKFWRELTEKNNGAIFVLWTSIKDLQHIDSLASKAPLVLLSGSLTARQLTKLPKVANNNVYLAYPFELPSRQKMRKTLLWARLKKVDYTDTTILGNTYFTATMITDVFKHLQSNFYRDYFMERIEHMVDNMTTRSVYPGVSLGAGQRFASKGCYIVKLDPASKDGFTPVTGWITP